MRGFVGALPLLQGGENVLEYILIAVLAVAFVAAVIYILHIRKSAAGNGIDSLTGLYNRDRFLREGEKFLHDSNNAGKKTALVIYDVDGFGRVSTLFGNSAADDVVKRFARCAQVLSDGRYPCGRTDTDDIAVFVNYNTIGEIDMFIRAFREELNEAFAKASPLHRVDFYTGVVTYDGCDDVYTMFSKANLCLMSKQQGRVTYFTADMEQRLVEEEFMRTEMLSALDKGEFELYYQPKISFGTGEIMGVEALIRWHHPTKGFVSPAEFIPLAEKTGIITKIDEWGLRAACEQCKKWLDDGLPAVKISVNMSQAQFYCTDIISTVKNVLNETGLPPQLLEIEVTETMAMKDIERTVNVLRDIRSMGVSVSMDDFGSGYSSLSSLKTIPLDILKIDRSLVCDIDENDVSKQITGAIVDLGKAMKLIVLAEGVETSAQNKFLTEIGCDLAQGYLYSKPCPASEITAMLILPQKRLKAKSAG